MAAAGYPNRPASRPIWPIALIAILVLGGLGVYFYNATRPRPALVERRDIVGYVPLSGEIVTPPSAYGEVRAPYAAPVDKIYTSVGAAVKQGDVLVQLANPSATENYEQARANVRAAETAYANAKRSYDEQVSAAKRQAAAAQASPAAPPASDTGTPADGASPPGTTVTRTTTTTTTATGAPDLSVQQAIADRNSGLASYQQQLDAARAAYRDARAGRRQSQLHAPISGTVIALNAQPGNTGGQDGAPVAVVVDLAALEVQAGMTPAQAGLVRTGLPASLTFSSVPDKTFEGKVRRITTQADPNSSSGTVKGAQYVALLSFKNTDGLVKPKAAAEADVKIGEVKNAEAVPVHAVTQDESGKPVVKVLENGKWRTVTVETGLSDGRYVQIKSGLKEGETVQVARSLAQASAIAR